MNIKTVKNMCRLCLKESLEIVEELTEGCDILDKLFVSLAHYVTISDDLPNRICNPCIDRVEEIFTFHKRIQENENILLKKLNICDNTDKEDCNYDDENVPHLFESKLNADLDVKQKKSDDCSDIFSDCKKEITTDSPSKVLTENNDSKMAEIKFQGSKKFSCLTCFEFFPNQLDLLKHYKTVEIEKFKRNNKQTDQQIETIEYKIQETEDGLLYKCEKCFKKYKHKNLIARHIQSHIQTRPFLCKLCGKTYQTASIIVAHGKMHTGEMHSCSYNCGYKSVHKHVVKDHEKRHRKEYKYKCETCSKGFQVKTWYEQHQNIHKGIKPFSCDLCGMAFHLHKYLMTHRSNVHPQSSERKPWVCKLCSEPCDSINSLNVHLKEMHGVLVKKSILCDICGKLVRDTQQLNQHKRAVHLHIKPYVCGVCNKSFPKKFTLNVHEQTHTGKQFLCNMCDKMFSRKSSLQRHILRFHVDSKQKCDKSKHFSQCKKVCSENCGELPTTLV